MVDLNGHQAGNGGYKPKKAYSSPGLLYSEEPVSSRGSQQPARTSGDKCGYTNAGGGNWFGAGARRSDEEGVMPFEVTLDATLS
jgi:hypothetical protein